MIKYFLIFGLALGGVKTLNNRTFPEKFFFGAGSSAYQIEGAWNEDGKGVNIFDYSLHINPDPIQDKSNGDVACMSYHKWREDIQLIKNLGVGFYRFSISWTRILPLGYKNSEINNEGVRYYSDIIDALLAEGIQPFITIYHFDLPQALQDKGGWLNESTIDDYLFYTRTLFQLYGDRVKYWTTFNEISIMCEMGYGEGYAAPYWRSPGVGGYQCAHIVLLAHALTYKMYEKEFRPTQGGMIGLTSNSIWCTDESDKEAIDIYFQFNFGWFMHPLFIGNYPPIMIERIDEMSRKQGYNESRLPKFTSEQIDLLKGSLDFIGLTHYLSDVCVFKNDYPEPSYHADRGVAAIYDDGLAPTTKWTGYYPEGFRKLLVWIKNTYNNPLVLIAENGWKEADLNDTDRISYHRNYLSALLDAIFDDGCNVFGYGIWSFMDSFEWRDGYLSKFGIVHVDFDSTNKTRTPRASYSIYKDIVEKRRID